ncbi:MAG: M16 family metallopeptidase [Sphingobacteriaceae bacterium]
MDRTQAPAFKQVEHISILDAQQYPLDNGIPLFFIDAGEQDLLRIEFIFDNVAWNPASPLQAFATNALLQEGTSNYTAAQLAEKFDYYGAFLQNDYSYDQSSVVLYTLTKHLPSVLPLLREILTDAIFPQNELDTFIRNQQQKLSVSLEKNDVLARRLFNQVLFGNTLYGHAPLTEDYAHLERSQLLDYYKKAYQPANCTIVLSGKVSETTLASMNAAFGTAWEGSVAVVKNDFAFAPGSGARHFLERPEALQSAIRLGQLAINRAHPDFPALQVLNTIFGGYFGSRLMANIREDKGYTYGIGSGIASLKDAGYFFIASEVGADVCNAAMGEIEKEMKRLRSELVSPAELDLVRNYMLGSLLGSLENAFSHADKFKNTHFFGLDQSYYEHYVQTVRTISPEKLLELANTYLQFDKLEKVIVGKQ